MNWFLGKVENVAAKFDSITHHNELDNPQNVEVAEFMKNYHALAFEIARYKYTSSSQTIEIDLCQSIVARIDAMNEFLLFYQSADGLFDMVMNIRTHYRMDELIELRNVIFHRLSAQSNNQSFPYAPTTSSYDPHAVVIPMGDHL